MQLYIYIYRYMYYLKSFFFSHHYVLRFNRFNCKEKKTTLYRNSMNGIVYQRYKFFFYINPFIIYNELTHKSYIRLSQRLAFSFIQKKIQVNWKCQNWEILIRCARRLRCSQIFVWNRDDAKNNRGIFFYFLFFAWKLYYYIIITIICIIKRFKS